MPGYGKYATKKYVRHEIEKEKWSRQYITCVDFDGVSTDGGVGLYYGLLAVVFRDIVDNGLFHDAPVYTGTDGETIGEIKYKIDYIKVKLRTATGENETTSAVSQTVRMLLVRLDQTVQEEIDNGYLTIVDDVDGGVKYDWLFGNKFGLYMDKWKYVHSWATDGDTTAGGQVFFQKFVKPKYTDTVWVKNPQTEGDPANCDNQNGNIVLVIVGDDPTGTNSLTYGFVEIGWRFKY